MKYLLISLAIVIGTELFFMLFIPIWIVGLIGIIVSPFIGWYAAELEKK